MQTSQQGLFRCKMSMLMLYLLSLLIVSTKSQTFNKPDGSTIKKFRENLEKKVPVDDVELEKAAEKEVPDKWTCPIPYDFDASLPFSQQYVLDAMEYIEKMTGWAFVERTNEVDYIVFQNTTGGCSSQTIGRRGGPQRINLDDTCNIRGVIVHEIMHAIGSAHEHQRSDRGDFVKPNEGNIDPDGAHNFPIKTTYNYGPYDYDSIMHYGKWGFAIDDSKMTLTPLKDLSDTCYIGQRSGLTHFDIMHLNQLIDGRSCSTLSRDPCDPTDIIICGADTKINGWKLVFQEYELFGTSGGKNRYRSNTTYKGDYFTISWSNGSWHVTYEGNQKDYLTSTDADLFTATWSQYNFATNNYEIDPEIAVSNVDCFDDRHCYVNIRSATDLKSSDFLSYPDPYVLMYGKYEDYWKLYYLFKTTAKLNTKNPIWNEWYWISPGSFDYLYFYVYDYDVGNPSDYMGQARLQLDMLTCNTNHLRYLYLSHYNQPGYAGRLKINVFCRCY